MCLCLAIDVYHSRLIPGPGLLQIYQFVAWASDGQQDFL